jgi:hypothetical protein
MRRNVKPKYTGTRMELHATPQDKRMSQKEDNGVINDSGSKGRELDKCG